MPGSTSLFGCNVSPGGVSAFDLYHSLMHYERWILSFSLSLSLTVRLKSSLSRCAPNPTVTNPLLPEFTVKTPHSPIKLSGKPKPLPRSCGGGGGERWRGETSFLTCQEVGDSKAGEERPFDMTPRPLALEQSAPTISSFSAARLKAILADGLPARGSGCLGAGPGNTSPLLSWRSGGSPWAAGAAVVVTALCPQL